MTDEGAVLLVDDDDLILQSLSLTLEDAGYAVTTANGGLKAVAICRANSFEVVVCDIRMPGMNGIETLRAIKEIQPDVRTVVITGYASDSGAPLEAVRLGVDDYLLKPFPDDLLLHSLEQNVKRFRLQADNARLTEELKAANARLRQENTQLKREVAGQYRFDEIIGSSAAMESVFRLLEPVIDSDITVLLGGETGTGKDLIARAIHYNGPRKEASFVPVHCGAIQESLLESELFGVIPDYPGLQSRGGKKGLFEEADGGTLFLDEVGEMGAAMQVKLLRALQDGQIQRVGDTQPHQVDVRIVAATNRDLEKEVEDGRFRQDLFYRLSGIDIRIPPLWERREDIPVLARHFLEKCRARNATAPAGFAPEALEVLGRYAWPGNVRELQKEVERAVTLASGEDSIGPDDLSTRVTGPAAHLPPETGSGISLDELERRHVEGVLEANDWNIQRASELLGIHRNTLTRKMSDFGLKKPN